MPCGSRRPINTLNERFGAHRWGLRQGWTKLKQKRFRSWAPPECHTYDEWRRQGKSSIIESYAWPLKKNKFVQEGKRCFFITFLGYVCYDEQHVSNPPFVKRLLNKKNKKCKKALHGLLQKASIRYVNNENFVRCRYLLPNQGTLSVDTYPRLWTTATELTVFHFNAWTYSGFDVSVSMPLRRLGVVEYLRPFLFFSRQGLR